MLADLKMVRAEPCSVAAIGQFGELAGCRGALTIAEHDAVAGLGNRQEVHRWIREHPRRGGIHRLAVDRRGRAELGDATFGQGGDIAAQQKRFLGFRGGVDKDRAGSFENFRNLDPQLFAQLVVEVGQRLIEQHQTGILDQRPRQRTALLLTTRQFQRLALQHRGELHQLRGFAHAGVDLGLVHAHQLHRRGDVVIHAHRRVVDELLIHHRDLAILNPLSGHILIVPEDLPRGGRIKPGHQPHQRCLARQGRPKQHIHRAFFQRQIRRVDMGLPLDGL